MSVEVLRPARRPETSVQVLELDAQWADRWDAYVGSSPGGSFFHLAGWKRVLERVFHHETHFLLAHADGLIRGVLPLGYIRSRLFGNALISTPFCVYGGVVATDDGAREALEAAAESLAARLDVEYLELRNRGRPDSSRPTKDLYVTFRKGLDPDPEKNLLAIPRRQRAMVRKGVEAGLRSEEDSDVHRFFRTYAESVRNLGTPVFPQAYFRELLEVFGEDCEILTVTKDGRAVSSVLSFYFREEVLPYYGGGTHESRELKANDFMYWELMRRACECGVRVFDYGRSKKNSGSYHFKKNWGFEPEPLPYRYHLVRARKVPDVSPLNPKYRLLVALWKRLPLPVSTTVGPWISRSLG